jgi:hypothetical protein
MGGRFAVRWLVALAIVAALAGVAFYSYNLGLAHGIAQNVRVVEAPAGATGTTVPVVFYPRPWGFGFGFFPFLFILFWFFVARALFWPGRWYRRGYRCGERTVRL